MVTPDAEQLNRLRAWRTWLLIAATTGQGVQFALAPDRAQASNAYALLRPLGDHGWRAVGICLLLAAGLLVPREIRRWGHLAGAVLFLLLFWAVVLHGYFPAFATLAAGLNVGEFWLWQRTRS